LTTKKNVSFKKVLSNIRGYFFSGVLVTAPLVLTVYVIWSVILALDTFITDLFPTKILSIPGLPAHMPGIGLVLALVGLTVIGWLAKGYMGRWILGTSEQVLHKMPVIRSLYKTIKQIFEAIFKNDKNSFRQVVLVEYPREGTFAIGFLTGPAPKIVADHTSHDLLGIFIPTTPNPTSGFLLFMPQEKVRPLPLSVEEGIKLVVSIGLVSPEAATHPTPPGIQPLC
jgi:uncharacterized membrane protein